MPDQVEVSKDRAERLRESAVNQSMKGTIDQQREEILGLRRVLKAVIIQRSKEARVSLTPDELKLAELCEISTSHSPGEHLYTISVLTVPSQPGGS